MATEATSTFIIVHPTELVEVYGTTEKHRDVKMFLRPVEVEFLRKTFECVNVCGHLGHAAYHVRNGVPVPCESCGKDA